MSGRETWRAIYREARRIAREPGDGAARWRVICGELGLEESSFDLRALAIQKALEARFSPPRYTWRQELARTVLNNWGTNNPHRVTRPAGRFAYGRRAQELRDRLKAQGRLERDAGGWAVGVIPRSAGITADQFLKGRPVIYTNAADGVRVVAIYYPNATGPRRCNPPGVSLSRATETFKSGGVFQRVAMSRDEARAFFERMPDPAPLPASGPIS